ncbi:MAG: septal ring lytic transglycosylase RlpA family protein [Nitrospiraceae bacterium]|nr:septal ring lytic transglycosylase RlpA family protein [Nitrospiraceae bacterium]
MNIKRHPLLWGLMVGCGLTLGACSIVPKGQADLDVGMKERGIASWYGDDFHGWVTASGEIYDMYAMTGAHRTLPLGTIVRVTNVVNGRHVHIRINDRGPYVKGRILDLSYKAAQELHMVGDGVSAVYLEVTGSREMNMWSSGHDLLKGSELSVTEPGSLALYQRPERGSDRLVPTATLADRHIRRLPSDLLRERRARRVGDILAAGQRTDGVPSLALS